MSQSNDKLTELSNVYEFRIIVVEDTRNELGGEMSSNIEKLRSAIGEIRLARTPDDCAHLIQESDLATCFVVTPGSITVELMDKIGTMKNLDSVYVLCTEKKLHRTLRKDWPKVRSIHTAIRSVTDELQIAIEPFTSDIMTSMYFIETNTSKSGIDPNNLDTNLVYSILLRDSILDMYHNREEEIQNMVEKLASKCRDYPQEQHILKIFSKTYTAEKSIWWFTRNCCISKSLKQALRESDADTVVDMSCFIQDIQSQLDTIRRDQMNQYGSQLLTVYFGQSISNEYLSKLRNTKNGFLILNSFLSASTKYSNALDSAQRFPQRRNCSGVLFNVKIDPKLSNISFADIKKHRYSPNGNDILFGIQSIFRVESVKHKHEKNIDEVSLVLISETDPQIIAIKQLMKTKVSGVGWFRVACILTDMGNLEKAEEIHSNLLKKATDDRDKAVYNHRLGSIKLQQGNYTEAIQSYENMINHAKLGLLPDDPVFSTYYVSIGNAYHGKGDYSKALEHYEQSLNVLKKALPKEHPSLAISYNDIGTVYSSTGNNLKAIEYYERAIGILKSAYGSDHSSLMPIYNSIGQSAQNIGDFSKALVNYRKFLTISKKLLPEDHLSLASTYNSVGQTYQALRDYPKALQNYEQALTILKRNLPADSTSLGVSYHNIGQVYQLMGEHTKAISNYEKLLHILQATVSADHPSLAVCYNNIGQAQHAMKSYSKAMSNYTKSLEILKKATIPNNPSIAVAYSNIAQIYHAQQLYADALLNYKKLLKVLKKITPQDNALIAAVHRNIAQVYSAIKNNSKTFYHYDQSIDILKEILPQDDHNFGDIYYEVAVIYHRLGDYPKALSFFEKSLRILKKSVSPNDPRINHIRQSMKMLK